MEKKFQFFRKLLLLTLLMLGVGSAFAAWDGSIATTAPGTEKLADGKDYYKIENEAQLAWFAAQVNSSTNSNANPHSNINAILKADMDMSGHLWTPIAAGKGDTRFKGIFDGNGHKIIGLYIHGEELAAIHNNEYCNVPRNNKPAVPGCNAQNLGFVGSLDGTVRNLILEDVDIHASTNAGEILSSTDQQISVGAVVGWLTEAGGKVDNCMVTGSIKTTGKGQGVGGIVGNAKKGTITNCMSLVEIQTSGSQAYIGGIIGITKTDVTVTSCVYAGPGLTNTGTNGAVGGIAGNVWSGTMSAVDSYYEGTNYYQDNEVGGIGKDCGNDCSVTSTTVLKVDESNEDEVACTLNGGTYTNNACDKTGPWSIGETGLSLDGYGIDGYKITFDANGGEFPENAKTTKFLQSGQVITADEITNPRRDGKAFAGWALTSNAQEPVADFGTANKAMTIYAVWNPVYTITFNVAPGVFPDENVNIKTKKVASGETITVEGLGTLPTKRCKVYVEGNENECQTWSYFTGWALTAGAPERDSVSLDTVTASDGLVLHAVWTDVETYTVTYNANQHGRTAVDYVRVGAGDTVTAPTNPIADVGYEFDGWFTDAEGENPYKFAAQIHESIILYAKWALDTFTVTYEMNGVSNAGENPAFYTIETPTFALAAPADSEGYVFEGWFYDANFTNPASQVIQGTTGDKTFYAKWTKKTYRVMYLADNNSYGSISDQFVEHGTTINLESAGIFRRAGYNQNGWSATMGGAKTNELGESVTVVAPITLYPTWSWATYTITYVCDGCVNDPSNPTTYDYNTQKGIKFATAPEGYSFAGWFKEPDFQTQVTQIVKKSYGDLTLYGKQLVLYTITYVGTDNPYGDKTYTSEKAAQLRGCAPREGYTFAGWYDNADFEGDAVTEVPLGSTGDKTFYAKWTPITYTITYVIDGEENAIEAGSFTVEGAVTLPTPTKDQYTFDGWYETDALTGDKVTGFDAGTYKTDKTFYAKWDKVYPFVTQYAAVTVTENADDTKTATVNDGYTAAGTVNIPTPIEVDNIVINRTFSAGTPGTIMLPFTLPSVTTFNNAKFYYLQKVEQITNKKAWKATMKWIGEGNLPEANKPYGVICQNTTLEINLNGEKATLQTSLSGAGVNVEETGNWYSDETGNWRFVGVYAYKHWTENEDEVKDGLAYALAGSAGNGLKAGDFGRVTKDNEIYPMRSYMRKKDVSVQLQPVAQTARAWGASYGLNNIGSEIIEVEFVDDEKTTAIGHLNTVTGEIKIDRWFDLKGRSVKNVNRAAKGAYYGKKGFHE